MLTKTQLKILSYLIDNKEKLAGIRELAREISVAYYLVQMNVQDLKSKKIITLQRAGKTDIIRINESADSSYLIEAEKFKKEEFYRKFPEIKVTLNKLMKGSPFSFFVILIFGSYAKKPRKDSDLDLLIIVPDENSKELMQRTASSVSRTSLIKIHETILTEDSFTSMLNKKELNVVAETINNHVIIYGGENYYKLIK